jgi:hypothetical protein
MIDEHEALDREHAAAARGRPLLELTGRGELAHGALVAANHFSWEALGEEELTLLSPRFTEADAGEAAPLRLELHRQAEVHVAELALEDVAREVLLVQPLHDEDDRRAFRRVEPGGDRFRAATPS